MPYVQHFSLDIFRFFYTGIDTGIFGFEATTFTFNWIEKKRERERNGEYSK